MADFGPLKSQKLISREIWVIEQFWNFHTVKKYSEFVYHRNIPFFPEQTQTRAKNPLGPKLGIIYGNDIQIWILLHFNG